MKSDQELFQEYLDTLPGSISDMQIAVTRIFWEDLNRHFPGIEPPIFEVLDNTIQMTWQKIIERRFIEFEMDSKGNLDWVYGNRGKLNSGTIFGFGGVTEEVIKSFKEYLGVN